MTTAAAVRRKHILICNERILFRFGVDRILVETAKKLIDEGWRVSFACLRCDRDVIGAITPHIYVARPRSGIDLYDHEADCEALLDDVWGEITAEQPVDAILVGGWPFFHVGRFGRRRGIPTVFVDAGAVPHDGLGTHSLSAQQAVRRVRAVTLAHFDHIWSISAFIRNSQTLFDRGTADGVEVIPLGVDHLAANVFTTGEATNLGGESEILREIERLARRGVMLVLNLGRFETEGYKNSPASFDLLRGLLRRAKDDDLGEVRLLVLAKEGAVEVPADVAPHVICLGSPSDAALVRIMELASVGFSPSLWEGFNLPIGEMTILGKPVIAFNVGAHPEVVLHPWFLCTDIAEAVQKVVAAARGGLPHGLSSPERLAAYRDRFSWQRTLSAYHERLEALTEAPRKSSLPSRLLLVDVSNSSRDTANSGVVRVTRRLTAALTAFDGLQVLPVWWDGDHNTYRFVTGARHDLLAGYSGPRSGFGYLTGDTGEVTVEEVLHRFGSRRSVRATLFLPEVVMTGEAEASLDWAHRMGLSTAAILYDLIPVDHPEYCSEDLCRQFPKYLRALSQTKNVISISEYSRLRFLAYLNGRNLPVPRAVDTVWLPGQLSAVPRIRGGDSRSAKGPISIVCVSTLEPRKNHLTLIAAYQKFKEAAPDAEVRLTLIGNTCHGAEELAAKVKDACAADPTIVWRGAISDEEMVRELRAAAFTVYASLVEGFGLPVLESLWIGKPCLCHDGGVMAELAADGGCVTVDMTDVDAVADALRRLVTDSDLRDRLVNEASGREILDWNGYATEMYRLLFADVEAATPPSRGGAEWSAAAAEFRADVESVAQRIRDRIAGFAFLDARARSISMPGAAAPAPADVATAAATAPAVSPASLPAPHRPGVVVRLWERLFVREGPGLTKRKVLRSGLFDAEWYLAQNPDVKAAGIDPLRHFILHGHRERRSPGPGFDARLYVAANPEVVNSALTPFEHYIEQLFRRD